MGNTAFSNSVAVAIAPQVDFETEAPSGFTLVRHGGESLGQQSGTTQSQEIDTERNVKDLIRTSVSASGDINIEQSYGAHDALMEAVLGSAARTAKVVTANVAAATTGNKFTVSSGTPFSSVAVGDWVKTVGFPTAVNNGVFKVTARTDTSVTVIGATLVTETAGAAQRLQHGGAIKNGAVERYFTIHKHMTNIADGAGTKPYHTFLGMVANTFNLNIANDAPITGSFGFIGSKMTPVATKPGGAWGAAPANGITNGIDSIDSILEGSALDAYKILSATMQGTNNARALAEAGSAFAIDVALGTFSVTGSIRAYFRTSAELEKFLNNTDSAISFVVTDKDGNTTVIELPLVNFTSGASNAPGRDQDVIVELGFQAVMHATEAISMRVTSFDKVA